MIYSGVWYNPNRSLGFMYLFPVWFICVILLLFIIVLMIYNLFIVFLFLLRNNIESKKKIYRKYIEYK